MVLEIPKVTTEDTGHYVCQQMSDSHRSDFTPKTCFLFVNGEGGGGQRERERGGEKSNKKEKKKDWSILHQFVISACLQHMRTCMTQ